MQDILQIEFDNDEELVAVGEKNQVMFFCNTLLFGVLTIFFFYQSIIIKNFFGSFYFGFLSVCFLFTNIFFIRSYLYNQIYLTDKKIVITKKNSIDIIQYEEIKHFMFSFVYLKSKRVFFFAYTNLDDLIIQFKELYPSFEQKLFTFKDIFVILFALILILYFNFLPIFHKFFPKDKKTPSNYEELTLNKDYYMLYLQKKLKSNWKPPKLTNDTKVVVEFQILQDGTITKEKIIETSGNREFDNAALFALR